jgi:cytoskeletal protein RodZ
VNKNILVVAVVSILVIGGVFASNYLKTEETPSDQINGNSNETTTIPDEDTPEPSETDTEDAPEQSNEAEPEDEPEPTTENETPHSTCQLTQIFTLYQRMRDY